MHVEHVQWFSLRHNDYCGSFSADFLKIYEAEADDIAFDFDNYTYIFTIGHELVNIEYSYSQFKNRRLLFFPEQLVGIVTLDENLVDMVFVYRVKRMNIDLDYHSPRVNVYFTDSAKR